MQILLEDLYYTFGRRVIDFYNPEDKYTKLILGDIVIKLYDQVFFTEKYSDIKKWVIDEFKKRYRENAKIKTMVTETEIK